MRLLKQITLKNILFCLGVLTFSVVLVACGTNEGDSEDLAENNESVVEEDEVDVKETEDVEQVEAEKAEDLDELDISDYPELFTGEDRGLRNFNQLIDFASKIDVEWTISFSNRDPADFHLTYEWLGEHDGVDTIQVTFEGDTLESGFDVELDVEGDSFTLVEEKDAESIEFADDEYGSVEDYIDHVLFYSESLDMMLFEMFPKYEDAIEFGGGTSPLVDVATGTATVLDYEFNTDIFKTGDDSGGTIPYANGEVEVVQFDELVLTLHARDYVMDEDIFTAKWHELELNK